MSLHEHHAHHAHHGTGWSAAVSATLHCLTGCAIGEVTGMVVGTALGWGTSATVVLSVALAFVFGYALTASTVMRAGETFARAARVALAVDTLSILTMELVDNGVMVAVPGAMEAGLGSLLFWASLAFSLGVAFVLTVPVNRWLLLRGKGHTAMHAYH